MRLIEITTIRKLNDYTENLVDRVNRKLDALEKHTGITDINIIEWKNERILLVATISHNLSPQARDEFGYVCNELDSLYKGVENLV